MLYLAEYAKKYNCTPILTFYQPLWWKSLMIALAKPDESTLKQMVLKLGPFHQLMNILGSIGVIMENSGLKNVLERIYGSNTTEHMLSGKAVETCGAIGQNIRFSLSSELKQVDDGG